MTKKNIVILGATGSIGTSALDIVRQFKGRFRVAGLSAYGNIEKLEALAREFSPEAVSVADEARAEVLKKRLKGRCVVFAGRQGSMRLASLKNADLVLVAMVGSEAIYPLLAAIRSRKVIALANKESIVVGGSLVMKEVYRFGVSLIPIDSEQSAIFQCLKGHQQKSVANIFLTASGGPLVDWSAQRLKNASSKKVLSHPRWHMGPKITVDSATLMNKGLEVIEAQQLFDVPLDKIRIVVHRQAVIHSMVSFCDGSVLAQMGLTDMRLPIQYALTYPERWPNPRFALDPFRLGSLTFEAPDMARFPCLRLAYEAAAMGGTAPCALNAANEVAVNAFLKKEIAFFRIPDVVEKILTSGAFCKKAVLLDDIFTTDESVRREARSLVAFYAKRRRPSGA
jgi:1-deoxy-D-xylulose-5-phosphate reductoisomerase